MLIYSQNIKEGSVTPGHSSRVYCVKFDKEYPNLVLSGGWDYRVILWDLREGKPVNSNLSFMTLIKPLKLQFIKVYLDRWYLIINYKLSNKT